MSFYAISCVCVCLPGDVAELDSNTLSHAPLLRKHASVFLLIVHQLPFDPSVAAIDLVQPCNLSNKVGGFSINTKMLQCFLLYWNKI